MHVRWNGRLVMLGLCVALALAMSVRPQSSYAQDAPTVQITEPSDGATIDGPFSVRIKSSGFRFAGLQINQEPKPNTGLWVVNIDGQFAGLATAPVVELPNDNYPTLTAGEHTLTAELRGLDFAALNPPVTYSVKINLTRDVSTEVNTTGEPTLRFVAPGENATIDGPFLCRVEHSGVKFDGLKIGKDPEPGVGHWHVNIDGIYAGLAVSEIISLPNGVLGKLSPGAHTITVDLHQNNHAVFDPPVFQSFQINVTKELAVPAAPGAPAAQPIPATRFDPTGNFTALPNTGIGAERWWPLTSVAAVCLVSGGVIVGGSRRREAAKP